MNTSNPLRERRPTRSNPVTSLRTDRLPRLRPPRWRAVLRDSGRRLRVAQARTEVVIRPADAADARLERLADLDGRSIQPGIYVVAEIEGELVAAVPVTGGETLADPFRPTGDLVALLELRARQLTALAALAA